MIRRTRGQAPRRVGSGVPVEQRLSEELVQAFADRFPGSMEARLVLAKAGFPVAQAPFTASSPLEFWTVVAELLARGVMADGRARLLAAARQLYEAEPLFTGPAALDDAVSAGRAFPVGWNVPARLVRFVGREDLLREIDTVLAGAPRVALVALEGMGGVGKTSLAVEYAHRHAHDYQVVYWVAAERPELVARQLGALAGLLELPVGAGADRVWAALGAFERWLVVFDNVEDPEAVARFRPSGGGRVLVTSRQRAARGLGIPVTVPLFTRAASVELLTARAPGLDADSAGGLAALLGDLPLAVEQAAGFLDATSLPVAEYGRLLSERPEDVVDQGQVLDRAGLTVANLWTLSVASLRARCPAAVELLELCALFAAEPVPLGLFTASPDVLGDSLLGAAARDTADWAGVVGALVGYNLARLDSDSDRLTVHRLVAAATRRAMPAETVAGGLATVAGLLRAQLPDLNRFTPGTWGPWRDLLPHVLAVAERALTTQGPAFGAAEWLAGGAANYLREHGQHTDAIRLLNQLIASEVRVLGPDDPRTLYARSRLAVVHEDAGRLDDAIAGYEAVLADRERILGDDHPDTVFSRRRLAGAQKSAGRHDDAIASYERVAADHARILGRDHGETLLSRSLLAGAYQAAGRLAEAIAAHETDLADRERVLGPDGSGTLYARSILAGAYQAVGRLDEALDLFEQVAAARERTLGTNHLSTQMSRSLLADAYRAAGWHADAIALPRSVLDYRERVLGSQHPTAIHSRSLLAEALQDAGEHTEAIALFTRCLADRERLFGPDHPRTAFSGRLLADAIERARLA
ncbi:FxSxx-COOH system tetratricopeptide repeat protein [Frankia nepalensis]|nr:FxSxx-COOH system tetratricopeptide repeat protein [Frankia nepalensis]